MFLFALPLFHTACNMATTLAEALQSVQAGPSATIYSHDHFRSNEERSLRIEEQLERIKEVQRAIAQAQTALTARDGDWGKLARSLREM